MQRILGLISNHWLAKLLSLVLAVTLWGVVRKNVGATLPRPGFQFEVTQPGAEPSFQIDTQRHGESKK